MKEQMRKDQEIVKRKASPCLFVVKCKNIANRSLLFGENRLSLKNQIWIIV